MLQHEDIKGTQRKRTKTGIIRKALCASFNESFEFPNVDATDTFKIQVWDWDRFSKDDSLGRGLSPL